MARNKRHLEPSVKKKEIELIAMGLFKVKGYDNTTMAEIAKIAGVAANTVYWYFENKDDVLIAALNRVVSQAMSEVASLEEPPLRELILMLIAHVESAGSLMTDVHTRVNHSPKVQAWHDHFHMIVENFLLSKLDKKGAGSNEALIDAKLLIYVIEGLLAHPHNLHEREHIIDQALKRVLT